jgi:hypothetical protein
VTLLSVADLPFAPPTGTHLSFLSCPPDAAARAFVAMQVAEGRPCVSLPCPPEDVPVSLTRLEPLSFLGQRHLFIPTAPPGWTAYFNNYALGANASSVLPGLAQALRCRAVLIEAVPLGTNGEASEALGLTVLKAAAGGDLSVCGTRRASGGSGNWASLLRSRKCVGIACAAADAGSICPCSQRTPRHWVYTRSRRGSTGQVDCW